MTTTSQSIRWRRRPSVDSPLARYILGELDAAGYVEAVNAKRRREGQPELDAADLPLAPRRS